MPDEETGVEATPAAEELAQAEGVNLEDVEGSGAEGRILVSDVEAAAAAASDEDTEPSEALAQAEEEAQSSPFAKAVAEDKGFIGSKVDPTDNHAYTVEGVTAGEPTPETDKDAYDEALARRREVRQGMTPEGTSLGRQAD